MNRVCGKCKTSKPLSDFYKKRDSKDGLQVQCIACMKIYRQVNQAAYREKAKAHYAVHREDTLSRVKAYQQTVAGKMVSVKADKRRYLKYPEKTAAKNAVNYAVQSGKLKRSVFCEECGLPKETEGHHPNYNKPLEVEWLCVGCHRKLHKSSDKENKNVRQNKYTIWAS